MAFEAVNKAYKMLEDEKERKKCLEVVDEARERVDAMVFIYLNVYLILKIKNMKLEFLKIFIIYK